MSLNLQLPDYSNMMKQKKRKKHMAQNFMGRCMACLNQIQIYFMHIFSIFYYPSFNTENGIEKVKENFIKFYHEFFNYYANLGRKKKEKFSRSTLSDLMTYGYIPDFEYAKKNPNIIAIMKNKIKTELIGRFNQEIDVRRAAGEMYPYIRINPQGELIFDLGITPNIVYNNIATYNHDTSGGRIHPVEEEKDMMDQTQLLEKGEKTDPRLIEDVRNLDFIFFDNQTAEEHSFKSRNASPVREANQNNEWFIKDLNSEVSFFPNT